MDKLWNEFIAIAEDARTKGGVPRVQIDCYGITPYYAADKQTIAEWLHSKGKDARCRIETETYPDKIFIDGAMFHSSITTFTEEYVWNVHAPGVEGNVLTKTYFYKCQYAGEVAPDPKDMKFTVDYVRVNN